MKPLLVEQGCDPETLDETYISETLSIYYDDLICITRAAWGASGLEATVASPHYPFTKPGYIDYVTAGLASLVVSQLGYLAGRKLLESPWFDPPIPPEHFFKTRDSGDLVFANLTFSFHERLDVANIFEARFSYERIRTSGQWMLGGFSASLGDRTITAKGIITMPLPPDVL